MGRQRWRPYTDESSDDSDASEYSGRHGKQRADSEAGLLSARLRPRQNRTNLVYREVDSELEDLYDGDADAADQHAQAAAAADNLPSEVIPIVLYTTIERFLARRPAAAPSAAGGDSVPFTEQEALITPRSSYPPVEYTKAEEDLPLTAADVDDSTRSPPAATELSVAPSTDPQRKDDVTAPVPEPEDSILAAAGSGNTPLEESAFSDASPTPQVLEPVESKGNPSSRSLYTSQPTYRGTFVEPPPGKWEYLVKYYNVSYLHCEWLPEWEVQEACNADRTLRTRFSNFLKRLESGLEVPEVNLLDCVVERVVDSTDQFRALYPQKAAEGSRQGWVSLCLRMLDTMVCFVRNHRSYGLPFLHPVDEEADGAPGYYQVVKKPMDFTTVQTRLYLNQYAAPQNFWADVKTIFANCHEYNAPNTEICVRARLLEALFDKLYQEWATESRAADKPPPLAPPREEASSLEVTIADVIGPFTFSDLVQNTSRRMLYQVKWKGRSYSETSWEKQENIADKMKIAQYHRHVRVPDFISHPKGPGSSEQELSRRMLHETLLHVKAAREFLHGNMRAEIAQALPSLSSGLTSHQPTRGKWIYNNPDFGAVRTGRTTAAAIANAAADREQQVLMSRQAMLMHHGQGGPLGFHPFNVPFGPSTAAAFLTPMHWAALQQQAAADPAAYAALQQGNHPIAVAQHLAAQQQAHRRLISTQQQQQQGAPHSNLMYMPGGAAVQQILQQHIAASAAHRKVGFPGGVQPPPYSQEAVARQLHMMQQQQQKAQQQQQHAALQQSLMQHQAYQQQQQHHQAMQQQMLAGQQAQQQPNDPSMQFARQQQLPQQQLPHQPPPPQCEGCDPENSSFVGRPEGQTFQMYLTPGDTSRGLRSFTLAKLQGYSANVQKRACSIPLSPYERDRGEVTAEEECRSTDARALDWHSRYCEGMEDEPPRVLTPSSSSTNLKSEDSETEQLARKAQEQPFDSLVPLTANSMSVPFDECSSSAVPLSAAPANPSNGAAANQLGMSDVSKEEPTNSTTAADKQPTVPPPEEGAVSRTEEIVDRSRPATFAARSSFAKRFAEMKRPKGPPTGVSRTYPVSPVYKGGRKLFQYQLEGINWALNLWERGVNGILADEMGLGKTVQSVAILWHMYAMEKIRGPFLVVAPLSTLDHWRKTAEDWTDLNVILYYDENGKEGRKALRQLEWFHHMLEWRNVADSGGSPQQEARIVPTTHYKFQLLLTSYEIFVQDAEILVPIPWQYVIVDEAHRLKNRLSKTLQLLKQVACRYTLLLTGTPVQNNTEELWPLLNYIEPVCFCDLEAFKQEFGDLQTQEQVNQLMDLLRPHLLRRVKEDVADSIPPLEETIIDVELTILQKAYYKAIFERNKAFLFKNSRKGQALPSLMNIEMELRKCCNHPFMVPGVEARELQHCTTEKEQFKKLVESSGKFVLLDKLLPKLKAEGHKVLIFSQFQHTLSLIQEFLQHKGYNYERLDGQVKGNERTAAIGRFNDPLHDRFVFLLSTRAGGLGINLTSADTVIIFDSDWNPQNDVQATARAHRIGQEREVKVYRLVTARTYEADMFDRASKKLGLNTAVFHRGAFDKSAAGLKQPSKEEVENLLKKGAFHLLESGTAAARHFQEGDIEEILSKNSRLVRYQLTGTSSTFAKTSFRSDKASDLSFDDPDFWEKVLNDSSSRRLLARINDGSATASPEAMQHFMEDLQMAVEGIAAEDDPEAVVEALVQMIHLQTFSKADCELAEAWLSHLNALKDNEPVNTALRRATAKEDGAGGAASSAGAADDKGSNVSAAGVHGDARRSRRTGRRDAAASSIPSDLPESIAKDATLLQQYEQRLLRGMQDGGDEFYSDSAASGLDEEDDEDLPAVATTSKRNAKKKAGSNAKGIGGVRRGNRTRKLPIGQVDQETLDQAIQAGVPLDQLGLLPGAAAAANTTGAPTKRARLQKTAPGASRPQQPKIPKKRKKAEQNALSETSEVAASVIADTTSPSAAELTADVPASAQSSDFSLISDTKYNKDDWGKADTSLKRCRIDSAIPSVQDLDASLLAAAAEEAVASLPGNYASDGVPAFSAVEEPLLTKTSLHPPQPTLIDAPASPVAKTPTEVSDWLPPLARSSECDERQLD